TKGLLLFDRLGSCVIRIPTRSKFASTETAGATTYCTCYWKRCKHVNVDALEVEGGGWSGPSSDNSLKANAKLKRSDPVINCSSTHLNMNGQRTLL
ncbi:unnamed protein product, partial [Sphenostylis stenocarpa]